MRILAFMIIFATMQALVAQPTKEALPPPSNTTYWPPGVPASMVKEATADPALGAKQEAIERLRKSFRMYGGIPKDTPENRSEATALWNEIGADGALEGAEPEKVFQSEVERKTSRNTRDKLDESVSGAAYSRLHKLLGYWSIGLIEDTPENRRKFWTSLNYYFERDYFRDTYRWTVSCFLLPRLAVSSYLQFREVMEAVEDGMESDPVAVRLNQLSKAIACQAFTEPWRGDGFVPITVESFRGHGHWVGGNFGYRPLLGCGLICRNPRMIDVVAETISKAISVTSYNTREQTFWIEGMTADGAGWGHGRQNYIFSYPADALRSMVWSMAWLKDTPWGESFPEEKYARMINYIEAGRWYCFGIQEYGPTLMSPGRYGMRYHPEGGFATYQPIGYIANELLAILPEQFTSERTRLEEQVKALRGEAPEPSGCRYFWNQDDMIFRRKNFFIGINMFSRRSNTNEVVAKVSSQTEFLADGSTFIMSKPSTYTLAKGFWRATAVPGVTARQGVYKHEKDLWAGFTGSYNFAGGATSEGSGVCGFHYKKAKNKQATNPIFYGVDAHKSYFCFEHEMVCLGAGITNLTPQTPGDLRTTVDQTEWLGTLEYSTDGGKTVHRAEPGTEVKFRGSGDILFCQGSVGYVALGAKDFSITAETRPERWLEVDRVDNRQYPDRPKTLPILDAGFEHGQTLKDGTYSYVVRMQTPNMTELRNYYQKLPVEVLSNTNQLQAVRHQGMGITQAVFFDASAELNDSSNRWRVDAPAVLMIRKLPEGHFELTAGDPEQNAERHSLTVRCDPPIGGRSELVILLPGGADCGRPTTVVF